jgi:hypothetical protein
MEAAISWIVKLLLADRAEGKTLQGGVSPGVGLGGGDRVAGAALAAADERIAEATAGGISQLDTAVRARSSVGAERRRHQTNAQGSGSSGCDLQAR